VAHIEVQGLLKLLPGIANPPFDWRLEAIDDSGRPQAFNKSEPYYEKFIPS